MRGSAASDSTTDEPHLVGAEPLGGTSVMPALSSVSPVHLGPGGATQVELVGFLLIGLLGGAHCIGMCGPLVMMYSEQLNATRDSAREGFLSAYEVRQHALFNLGRTVSYALLGGLFGLLGALLFDLSSTVTTLDSVVRGGMGLLVGTFVVVVGTRYILGKHGSHSFVGSGPLSGLYQRATAHIQQWVDGPGIFGLGLVHGLLPCPLLYPAFLYAFARGSPLGGTVALGVLGLGTFPTVFAYGTIIQSVDARHRTRLHRLLGIVFLAMGWMLLSHALGLFGIHVPHIEIPVYQPLSP